MSSEYVTKHCSEIGFPGIADSDDAGKLLKEGVGEALKVDFESTLLIYCHMSVSDYLSKELGWSNQNVNYVEVMCRQTNIFQMFSLLQLPLIVMLSGRLLKVHNLILSISLRYFYGLFWTLNPMAE